MAESGLKQAVANRSWDLKPHRRFKSYPFRQLKDNTMPIINKNREHKLTSRWSLKEPLYIEKSDKKYDEYVNQIKKNGFSDTETWALDSVISEFILPRLKRFKEINNGFPVDLTPEKWDEILDDMIFAFEWSNSRDDFKINHGSESYERYKKGIRLFAEYYLELWW